MAAPADLRLTGLLLLALAPLAAGLQARRLNAPLPLGATAGDVRGFQVTPDESRVVFLADPDVVGQVELLSAPLAGPFLPTELSDPLLDAVLAFQVSPTSDRVVYLARRGANHGLYSTRPEGGARSRLLARGFAQRIGVSPDGAHVVFAGPGATGTELQTVPVDGGSAPRRLGRLGLGEGEYLFLPDGSRVVFLAQAALQSAPTDGSGPSLQLATIPGPMPGLTLTPDGSRALYLLGSGLTVQLFSVATDGSTGPVRLNEALQVNRRVSGFALAPDGGTVAYASDHDVADRFDLSSVPVAGGASTRLYTALDASASVSLPFAFSTDGSRVLFLAGPGGGASRNVLRSVQADGSAPPVVLAGPGGVMISFEQSLDGKQVAFTRAGAAPGTWELLSVPADGSALPVLVAPDAAYGEFARAPRADRLVYRSGVSTLELFGAPLSGGASPARLSTALPAGAQVQRDLVVTRSGLALYRADQEQPGTLELFEVPISGLSAPTKLHGPLSRAVVGDVFSFEVSGDQAFFVADQEHDDVLELFRVALGGGRVDVVSGPLGPDRDVFDFQVSPGGASVVYRSDQDENEKRELFRVAADGSGLAKISGPMPAFADVRSYRISPDGARVVFVADAFVDQRFELFSVDGSGVPLRLNGPVVPGGNVLAFEITPDSRRVVYRGDILTDGVRELFSAPIDASGGQVRLHGPLPAGGGVDSFLLSPDGTRVAFAGRVESGQRELFTAPVDGGSPPVKVNAPLASTKNVRNGFRFTAGGARLVFRLGPSNRQVYAAASDGSTGHYPLGEGDAQDLSFETAAAGGRVVFRKGTELYSALDDGLGAPVLLASECLRFWIAPDSRRVVFTSPAGIGVVPIDGSGAPLLLDPRWLADQVDFSPDGEVLLFHWISEVLAVPLDGSRPAALVGGQPVLGGGVSSFQTLAAGRVVLRGDLEVDGAQELWLAPYGTRADALRR